MHVETERSREIVDYLRKITFAPVKKVLARREDLESFDVKHPGRGRVDQYNHDFGEQIDLWGSTDRIKEHANPEFGFFCGFAEEIHFGSRSRCSQPPPFPLVAYGNGVIHTPKVGDMLMGMTQHNDRGELFSWWSLSCVQEKRFRDVMVGQTSFSADKLESKLTIPTTGNYTDGRLFWAVKALHPNYGDPAFFARIYREQQTGRFDERVPRVDWWLRKNILPINPSFFDEFLILARE
jgi:hypothetical protein